MKQQRYAIYTRNSSDMQNEISLEDQETVCREAIAERDGLVVAVYSDSAKSGWSLDRKGFDDLQRDAAKKLFDAVMFWKFDRLARNHDHAVMIKALLRHEFGLQLYCVEGFSEDDDDSDHSAMMEQMIAVFAAFYSKNLSTETKRGKKQRAMRGEFNGSVPPFGYDLVTKKLATEDCPAGLYINLRQAAIIRRAFRMYVSGEHSDTTVAEWMNSLPYIQRLRENGKPIGKDTVRDMLKNRIYTGRVPYAETFYSGSMGEGKRSARNRKEWFEGKHEGFISDELYDECQFVREHLTPHKLSTVNRQIFILQDRVYCARCASNKSVDLVDENYGKMRPKWNKKYQYGFYRCVARERGYHHCEQSYVRANKIDEQVAGYLSALAVPQDFRERIEEAINSKVENEQALRRITEIEEIVKRIDFSWEQGFLRPDEYAEKRKQLRQEIEALEQIDHKELIQASDLIENFRAYWDDNKTTKARKRLLSKIIKKVYVYDKTVIGLILYGGFSVVLNDEVISTEICASLSDVMREESSVISRLLG